MKIGTTFGLALIVLFAAFAGLFSLTGGPPHPAALPETQIVLAAERPALPEPVELVQPVVVNVEYDDRGTFEIVRSYADVYEDNAEALRDQATEPMRRRETWQTFWMIVSIVGLIALAFVGVQVLDTVKTVALVRAQSASTEQHEYKVG